MLLKYLHTSQWRFHRVFVSPACTLRHSSCRRMALKSVRCVVAQISSSGGPSMRTTPSEVTSDW